jgi:hypothetical protein
MYSRSKTSQREQCSMRTDKPRLFNFDWNTAICVRLSRSSLAVTNVSHLVFVTPVSIVCCCPLLFVLRSWLLHRSGLIRLPNQTSLRCLTSGLFLAASRFRIPRTMMKTYVTIEHRSFTFQVGFPVILDDSIVCIDFRATDLTQCPIKGFLTLRRDIS